MVKKPVVFLVAVLVAAVSWIFFKNFTVSGLGSLRVVPRGEVAPGGNDVWRTLTSDTAKRDRPARRTDRSLVEPQVERGARIQVATFNLQAFNDGKARKPQVMDVLARIVRRFDVLAVQEIATDSDDVLPRLVDLVNKTGQAYDYAIGPRLGPAGTQQQYGFVFNRRTVLLDRNELYTVDDRDDLFVRDPLVAWFRAQGPPVREAFTFSLVNVHLDPGQLASERDLLDDLLDAVRKDGRQEDDVILAGDFQIGPGQFGALEKLPDITFAVRGIPTDTVGRNTLDNLVLTKNCTLEFSGRGGVFDFLREYNLELNEALEISDHLPVWGEFSIYEGGQAGRIARRSTLEAETSR